ncbi:MAG: hypothetical protein IJV13_07490 [Prevotella sp.]|nr:hypothetical protein [Prevotella sp.]
MKATEQTWQQIERFLGKVTNKFPSIAEAERMTDIHVRVSDGELLAFDDDDNEITRCVVEQWIDYKEEDFNTSVISQLRQSMEHHRQMIEDMSILKPFSFVLENEEREHIAELMVVDGDTVIIGGDIMSGLDEELNDFLAHLLK